MLLTQGKNYLNIVLDDARNYTFKEERKDKKRLLEYEESSVKIRSYLRSIVLSSF